MIGTSKKANGDLRQMIRESGIPQYEIARRCGVGEGSLCRWLRYDLPNNDERRRLILAALEKGAWKHE